MDGIMQIYNYALPLMKLHGPTLFGPVIDYAISIATANINKFIYSVLIILTDGEIHDMNATID
jgi:hypothetical protein